MSIEDVKRFPLPIIADDALPVGEHSAKPDVFFTMVERLATGPMVELFARGPRSGWTTLGDQVGGAG